MKNYRDFMVLGLWQATNPLTTAGALFKSDMSIAIGDDGGSVTTAVRSGVIVQM